MQGSDHAANADRHAGCPVCDVLREAVPDAVARTGLAELTVADLACTAGVPRAVAEEHSPAGVRPHVVAAYLAAADRYFEAFSTTILAAPSWDGAVREAFRAFAAEIGRRPADAQLCFVEILGADRDLLAIRFEVRQRYVDLLTEERARRCPEDDAASTVRYELLLGATVRRITATVAEGRLDQLPRALEDVLEAAGVVEPLAA
jgi:hypothetical protein